MTWTSRVRKTFFGIKGLTDRESLTPHLATIGRLRKGATEERTRDDGTKYTVPVDLEFFRFTSEREDVVKAFLAAYGEKPKLLNVWLPYPSPEENFQCCMEEWRAGGLVHRCDGETMSLWCDEKGVYQQKPKPCPYFEHPERRTIADKKKGIKANPGCLEVGRLNVILPGLLEAGYPDPVVLVTTAVNDIGPIMSALVAVAEEQQRDGGYINLSGLLWTLRRVPEMVSTPDAEHGRVRRQKYLVRISPAVEWTRMQIARAQQEVLPELPPPWNPPPPDWEEVNRPGQTIAEVETEAEQIVEAEAQEVEAPEDVGEGATVLGEFGPAEQSAPADPTAADGWLADLKAALESASVDTRPASKAQKTKAALMLQQCWPEIDNQEILDQRRRELTRLALGQRLSECSISEASILIEQLGGDALSETAKRYVRELVGRALPGQTELFPEEATDA